MAQKDKFITRFMDAEGAGDLDRNIRQLLEDMEKSFADVAKEFIEGADCGVRGKMLRIILHDDPDEPATIDVDYDLEELMLAYVNTKDSPAGRRNMAKGLIELRCALANVIAHIDAVFEEWRDGDDAIKEDMGNS